MGGLLDFPGVAQAGEGFRLRLLALGTGGFHGAGEGAGGILAAGFLPFVGAAVWISGLSGGRSGLASTSTSGEEPTGEKV